MRPLADDYPPFYNTYIRLTQATDMLAALSGSEQNMNSFLRSIPESKGDFTYADGKWTVKEVVQHCIDTERIFAYRALCHARGEQQSLPGFEQDDYAARANVSHRKLSDLVEEFILVRQTSLLLFESLTPQDLLRTGIVNGNAIKTFCWAFIIEGHWRHHQRVLKEKYSL